MYSFSYRCSYLIIACKSQVESIVNVCVGFISLLYFKKAPSLAGKLKIYLQELIGKKTSDEAIRNGILLKTGDLINHLELSSNFFTILGRTVWNDQAINQGN